jgi:hypothetical protein
MKFIFFVLLPIAALVAGVMAVVMLNKSASNTMDKSAWDRMDMGSDNPDNVVGWIRQYATKEWLPKNPHPTETQVDAEVARILKHCRVDDDSMRSWTNEGNEAAFFGKGPDVSAQMNRRLMQRDMLQGAYASAFRNTVRDYAIVSEPSPTAPTVTSTATISRANAAATPNQQVVPSPTLSDQEIQQSRIPNQGVETRKAIPVGPTPAQVPRAERVHPEATRTPLPKKWYIIEFTDPKWGPHEFGNAYGPDEATAKKTFLQENPGVHIDKVTQKSGPRAKPNQ